MQCTPRGPLPLQFGVAAHRATHHHPYRQLDRLLVAQALTTHQRTPGLEVRSVSQRREQRLESPVLHAPATDEGVPHFLPVPPVGCLSLAGGRVFLRIAQDLAHHRPGATVVGVGLAERRPQARPTARMGFTASKASFFRAKIGAILGGAVDERRERQPDDGSRADRFGWPEGARIRYYDDEGNSISKEEWRELGRRKAERCKRDKAVG
jgi:hypothetical protein